MRFKLDENLSPKLAATFAAAGHDAMTVVEQYLGGECDDRVIEVCRRERRVLVTYDLDVANTLLFPPAEGSGLVVLRLASQAHASTESAVRRLLAQLQYERLDGTLWIVEDHRIRIHG